MLFDSDLSAVAATLMLIQLLASVRLHYSVSARNFHVDTTGRKIKML